MTKPSTHHRLGIDLGGSKILAVVIDDQGTVLGRSKRSTKPERKYQGVLERIAKTVAEALTEAGLPITAMPAAGLGLPGPVDESRTVVEMAVNLGWESKPVAKDLGDLLKLPVVLDNDVKSGALGEMTYGAARASGSALLAFVGTGLGGALVVDGKILSGAHGFAGEFGHMPSPFSTAPCSCGRTGCLETMVSKRGIARLIAEAQRDGLKCRLKIRDDGRLRSSDLAVAWKEKCPATRHAIIQSTEAFAWGLAAVGAAFDPERIVLGGGVIEALGELYVGVAAKRMPKWSALYKRHAPDLRYATLGDNAVAIGAAVRSTLASTPVTGVATAPTAAVKKMTTKGR